jgi:hypothetical protein
LGRLAGDLNVLIGNGDHQERLAENLAAPAHIVFDTIKFGAAAQNAQSLQGVLTGPSPDLST